MKDNKDQNKKILRSIKLPCGNSFDIEYNKSFEKKVKEMYNISSITDGIILDFFRTGGTETFTNFTD